MTQSAFLRMKGGLEEWKAGGGLKYVGACWGSAEGSEQVWAAWDVQRELRI